MGSERPAAQRNKNSETREEPVARGDALETCSLTATSSANDGKGVEKAGCSQVGSLSVGTVDFWGQIINSLSSVGGGRPVLCRTFGSSTIGFYLLDASNTTSLTSCNDPACHQTLPKDPPGRWAQSRR